MQMQSQVREILKQNNIAYDMETTGRNTIMQLQANIHGTDLIYQIYVRKKDYDVAKNLIRSIR